MVQSSMEKPFPPWRPWYMPCIGLTWGSERSCLVSSTGRSTMFTNNDFRGRRNVCFYIAHYPELDTFPPLTEWTGASMERTKMPNIRNGNKEGFEPRLTWLRVRHSTTELPLVTEYTLQIAVSLNLATRWMVLSTKTHEISYRVYM